MNLERLTKDFERDVDVQDVVLVRQQQLADNLAFRAKLRGTLAVVGLAVH